MLLLAGAHGVTRPTDFREIVVGRAVLCTPQSAAWFESNARSGFVKSVYSFKTDAIKVPDNF